MDRSGRMRLLLAGGLVAAAIGAVVALQLTAPDRVDDGATFDEALGDQGAVVGAPAPELAGLDEWINAEARSLEGLRGKVVLIDFWTYTCVNCIRTFPYLRQWHQRYADDGLVIIGVHTPEFAFERDRGNVEAAAERYGLDYPIALDNRRATWTAYRNQYWPRKYLIDRDGVVRYDHIGEGAYAETERRIQELLAETGADVRGIETVEDPRPASPGLDRMTTRELYAGVRGFVSGHIGNVDEYREQAIIPATNQLSLAPGRYTWPESPQDDTVYLRGLWIAAEEGILHARETDGFQDGILLRYSGASVNLVVRPEGDEPFDLLLELDGEPLNELVLGKDAATGGDGRTYVRIDGPRMYNLVNHPEFGHHTLKVLVKSERFSFYAFTFGAQPEP